VICEMFSGDLILEVVYKDDNDKQQTTEVKLPRPADVGLVLGQCGSLLDNTTSSSILAVVWGNAANGSAVELSLNFTASGDDWQLTNVSAKLQLTKYYFPGAADVDNNSMLLLTGSLPGLSHVDITRNHSLSCRSNVQSSSFSAMVMDPTGHPVASNTSYTVTAEALGFHLQAFNAVPNRPFLQSGPSCDADRMSDVVPVAVGCALGALVLLVLVSYLIGRRRRAAAYQSV